MGMGDRTGPTPLALLADAAAAADEAQELRRLARLAAEGARQLPGVLDPADALLTPSTWQGQSAARAADRLSAWRADLGAAVADVEDACERLLARARELEDRSASLAHAAGLAQR